MASMLYFVLSAILLTLWQFGGLSPLFLGSMGLVLTNSILLLSRTGRFGKAFALTAILADWRVELGFGALALSTCFLIIITG